MKILQGTVPKLELLKSEILFEDGEMVKAVVDIERQLVAIDANLHADLEKLLLDAGSKQDDLWGINFWPHEEGEDFIEFDSMINVRPRSGNRTRSVDDPAKQAQIREVVAKWIQ